MTMDLSKAKEGTFIALLRNVYLIFNVNVSTQLILFIIKSIIPIQPFLELTLILRLLFVLKTSHALTLSKMLQNNQYSKTCVKWPLSKRLKIGFQDQLSLNADQKYCRMLQGEHSAILWTCIKLPTVNKIFVLSIFE